MYRISYAISLSYIYMCVYIYSYKKTNSKDAVKFYYWPILPDSETEAQKVKLPKFTQLTSGSQHSNLSNLVPESVL